MFPMASLLEPEVAQHDPPHAVFGGPDGMAVIAAVVRLAGRWLRPGGLFAVEHDDTTSSQTVELVRRAQGFSTTSGPADDLAGRPRFVTARRWGTTRGRGTARMTEVFDCADPDQRSRGIASAAGALKGGRLVVMPTDTVYGIGADAFDSTAVAALLSAKGRGRDMPVGVLVGSWHTIEGLVYTMPDGARDLIRAFWPGALSLVVTQAPSLQWDLGDARGTVMLRMPLHPVAIELLREVGPMAVSSANVSGRPPAVDADEARNQLGDLVDVYLDAGPSEQQAASTIVDLTGAAPRILRAGSGERRADRGSARRGSRKPDRLGLTGAARSGLRLVQYGLEVSSDPVSDLASLAGGLLALSDRGAGCPAARACAGRTDRGDHHLLRDRTGAGAGHPAGRGRLSAGTRRARDARPRAWAGWRCFSASSRRSSWHPSFRRSPAGSSIPRACPRCWWPAR